MNDLTFFKIFLEKYKITNYKIIEISRHLPPNRKIIFNFENNCYYKIQNQIQKINLLDIHYFLNNAYFPNHLVSSIYDTELCLWIIKQTSAPGLVLHEYFGGSHKNTLNKNFIIKMMEWFKWQHTESRRLFPKITNKYFMCIGGQSHLPAPKASLSPQDIVYDVNTNRYTHIDFEAHEPWQHWYDREKYISFVFKGIAHLLFAMWENNYEFKFASDKEYPNLLNYCLEYLETEII